MDRSLASRFDYVTIGHVTCDLIEDRAGGTVSQPGGGAFYSALQASRLGLRTLIVTQGVPREIEALLEPYRDELELHVIAAQHTTTLSTHGRGERRSQRLLAWAGPILEPPTLDTAILHLAPVARETPVAWQGDAGFLGITPQGLVRDWKQDAGVPLVQLDAGSLMGDIPLCTSADEVLPGDIFPVELDPESLPVRFDAAVISEHECPKCLALFVAARRDGANVAVTAGSRPATVHLPGPGRVSVVQTALPALVELHDDLGAGDVFAAAFFIALADGRSPLDAANFANAAAVVRIAGVGPDAIGHQEQITP
jgi:pfkB family carbohydrate kinase